MREIDLNRSNEHKKKLLLALQNDQFNEVCRLLVQSSLVCEKFLILLEEKKEVFNGELSPILELLQPDMQDEKKMEEAWDSEPIDDEGYATRQALLQSMLSHRQTLLEDKNDFMLTRIVPYSNGIQKSKEYKTAKQRPFNLSDPIPEIFMMVLSFLYNPYDDSTRQDDDIYNPVTLSINRQWRNLTYAWLCHLHPQAKRQDSLGSMLLNNLVDAPANAPQVALLQYFQALVGPATDWVDRVQVDGVEQLLFNGCYKEDTYSRALVPPAIYRKFIGLKDEYYPSPTQVWATWGRLADNSLSLQKNHRGLVISFRDGKVASSEIFYSLLYRILMDSQRISHLISDTVLVCGVELLCSQAALSTQRQARDLFNGRHHRFMTSLADITPRGMVTVLHFQRMFYVDDNLKLILNSKRQQLLKRFTAKDLLWISKRNITVKVLLSSPYALSILLEDINCITEVLSHVDFNFLKTTQIIDPQQQHHELDRGKRILLLDYLISSLPAAAWIKLSFCYSNDIILHPEIYSKMSGQQLFDVISGCEKSIFTLLNQSGVIGKFDRALSFDDLEYLVDIYQENKLDLAQADVLQKLKQLKPKNEGRSRYELSRHIRYVPHQSNLDFQEQWGWQQHRSSPASTTTTTTTTFSAGTRQDRENVNNRAAPTAADSAGKTACLKTCLGYTLLTVGYLACAASIATGIGAIAGFTAATAVTAFVLPMLAAKTAGGIFIGSGIAASIMLFKRKTIKEKVVSCIPCCNSQVEPGFSMMA